ncbi:Transcription factor IIIB 50 kDa subunit [Turdus rufiventris]|nr:Transcription factor IIIB 50 kDa subunit [Turdus rufiventris]
MAARGRCPECGSESLVEDAHYAQQQLVCAACGCVLSEGLLTTTYTDEEHLREVAYSQSTGQKEQLSRCLQRGIRRVQDLCKVLQLPAVFEETAVSYFQRALQLPAFRLVSLEKKELLGGCCVFVTCRQRNWPLTMGTVCSLLYAKQDLFASVYLSLQKELELSVPALSLADLVTTHLNSFRLLQPTANIPAAFLEDKEKLLARTMAIVELASETWLVTGRHPVPIVTAAAFLAWQSLRPGPRLSCPLARFCRLAGVDLPPPAHLRLKELLEILLGMASQLSWLRGFDLDRKGSPGQGSVGLGSVDKDSSNKDSLHKDSPGTGSPGQSSVGPGTVDKDSLDKGSVDKDSQGRDSLDKGSPGQDSVGPSSLDKNSPNKDSPDKDSSGHGSPSSAPGPQQQGHPWAGPGRRGGPLRPLLPPCLIHPRKRLRPAAPSAPAVAATGDEPISDSEIEQYLRSPEEIHALRKARAWL